MRQQLPFESEPTIYVIHENDKWMEPLRDAFQEQGIKFVEWNLGTGGKFNFSAPPPEGVFYNRMSASSHTRGHRYAAEHTHAVLQWLELYNRRVVNSSKALDLEISKIRQYSALKRCGIPVPQTIVVTCDMHENKEEAIQELVSEAEINFPDRSFIIKHNRSGRGLGVRLFHHSEYLQKFLTNAQEGDFPVDGITLIQEYIRSPQPYITRCEFIGGEFIYAVRVNTSDGFELCPADHCSVIQNFKTTFEVLSNFEHPILRRYQQFLKQNGIEVAGIEFITDHQGNLWTYDVNTNTNYNLAAEKKAFGQMKGMTEIASFLAKELQKITTN